jgi:hypothetical protein
VEAVRAGKNLFNKNNYNVLNAYIDNSVIIASSGRSVVWLECEPNTAYTISRKAVATNERFGFGWTTEQPNVGVTVSGLTSVPIQTTVGATITRTLTTGADAKYLAIWMGWENRTSEAETMQIELGTTPTDYTPYIGTTHTATFDETVYGGDYDFVGGSGNVTRGKWSLKNRTWYKDSTGFWTSLDAIKRPRYGMQGGMICNVFETLEDGKHYSTMGNNQIALYNSSPSVNVGQNWVYIRMDEFTTTADFKAYIDSLDEVDIVAELAEPRTIQLDPQTITTLVGVNNVWGSGDVELTYQKSVNIVIPDLIRRIEALEERE